MNYCVIVHLGKNRISFWAKKEDGSVEQLIIRDKEPIPLYFYAHGNDFILGSEAREKYLNGFNINSFYNYFEIIKSSDAYFTVFNNTKHVKYLLYYAVEQYLTYFIQKHLLKLESIEGYRDNFPLRFIFEKDIEEKDKKVVIDLFSEAGYDNVSKINYDKFLFDYMIEEEVIESAPSTFFIVGIENNLFIEIFDPNNHSTPVIKIRLEDLGSDPRIKHMAKLIYNDAMEQLRIRLDEPIELMHLIPFALDFINQSSALPNGNITLSDGSKCWIRLKRKDLNDLLLYDESFSKINRAIDKIIVDNKISLNSFQIILSGDSLNTDYFVEKFREKYINVISAPQDLFQHVLKSIFKDLQRNNYVDKKEISVNHIDKKVNLAAIDLPKDSHSLPPKIQLPGYNGTLPNTNLVPKIQSSVPVLPPKLSLPGSPNKQQHLQSSPKPPIPNFTPSNLRVPPLPSGSQVPKVPPPIIPIPKAKIPPPPPPPPVKKK